MSKNQQTVNEPLGDELIGNTEIVERQFRWLFTVKSYLEMQLDEVQLKIDELKEKHVEKPKS